MRGKYTDVSDKGRELMRVGKIKYRPALHKHTVEVHEGGCWTFMITGKQIRKWGFWIRGGTKFVKYNKYFLEHGHHPCE